MGAGKTTLAGALAQHLDAELVKTSKILENEYGADPKMRESRRRFQELGEQLDTETGGEWVASAVRRVHERVEAGRPLVVDAVRIPNQLNLLRFEPSFRVILIYLSAPSETLESRYPASEVTELPSYAELQENETERLIGRMAELTQLRLDTASRDEQSVLNGALGGIALREAWWTLRTWPRRLALGAVCFPLFIPIGWFLWDWQTAGALLTALRVLLVAVAVLVAWLAGSALTGPSSPLERD